jgi:hypothetical protein
LSVTVVNDKKAHLAPCSVKREYAIRIEQPFPVALFLPALQQNATAQHLLDVIDACTV